MSKAAQTATLPRQRRLPRAEVRRRLLEAAATVFAARGYEAASLDDVAAEAGFSKGAVYSNFTSKRELFLTLMQERIEQRVNAVREVTRAGTLPERASRAGSELEGLLIGQPDWHLLFIEFWTKAMRDPELRQALITRRRPMRELIATFIDQQITASGLEASVTSDQLAVIVLALSNGLAIEHLADPETVDVELYGIALGLLQRGLTSNSPPTPRPSS
jgi:AcrR family transcriptional regulator